MSTSVPFGAASPFAGRTFIILNPAAGHDEPSRLRRSLGGAFAARGEPFDLAQTSHSGHATELAQFAVQRGYRAVCVVGGDGTLAEVAHALADTPVPLAIVPRGTGNQVAQNLSIPTMLEDAVDVAVNGVPTPIDLGRINNRTFALIAGAGYDAAVMAAATRTLKERWGFAAYVIAAAKEALNAEPAEFHITADGKPIHVKAVSVLLANVGELFAGVFPFGLSLVPHHPSHSWRDGLLDVLILAPRNIAGFAGLLWRSARRQFTGDDTLIHLQAREITIHTDPPLPVEIDGDPAGRTPITASAVPKAMIVLTPR